jgi:hypothetical protein
MTLHHGDVVIVAGRKGRVLYFVDDGYDPPLVAVESYGDTAVTEVPADEVELA